MRFSAAVLACCALGVLATGAQGGPVSLTRLLDEYHRGNYDEAVAEAAAADLGPLRLQFVQHTPAWIAADPAQSDARRRAVAAFLAELTDARLDADWGRLSELIEWTCVQVLRTGPPTEFERSWHMATTALASRARVRVWLLGPYARLPHQPPLRRAPSKDDPPSPRHLLHAIDRFPDDPRFELARVVAWTWGRDAEPYRNRRLDDGDRPRASRPAQLEALTALAPLTQVPAVAGEAWIRSGLISVTVADHAAALTAFQAALPLAQTPQLRYLSHFLAGRSLEMLQRLDDAIAAYEHALAVTPAAESATVALAGLHFLRNDRDQSLALIEKAFPARPAAPDPGRMIGYGAYLHWPQIKAAMRAELRP